MHLNSSIKLTWTSILMWTRLVIHRERGRAIFLRTEERQGRHGWPAAAAPTDEPGQAVAGKWGKSERRWPPGTGAGRGKPRRRRRTVPTRRDSSSLSTTSGECAGGVELPMVSAVGPQRSTSVA
jgi:hypothetical protein